MNNAEIREQAIIAKLKAHGYKITPQRLAIVKILSASIGHPSVEKIYAQVKQNFPTISQATVYKNIATIKSLGEVLELGFSDDSNRYDGNIPYPHPHAVCSKCKKIVDSQLDIFQDVVQQVTTETGFRITNHRIDFFGVCPDCQREEN